MAWRTTLKLPKLRVHQRASGYEKRSTVSREQSSSATTSGNEPVPTTSPDDNEADLCEHSFSPVECGPLVHFCPTCLGVAHL